ncbi:MAG: flagellar hook capping FlgD N-terminal domain-containing protein [Ignavibacteriota bacterium]
MATGVGGVGSNNPNTNGTSNNGSSNNGMVNGMPTESTFLQLLVAQLKYQDPTNPTDSTQFVSQLAQFSELEQVMGIRSDIESYQAPATSSTDGSTKTNG